ncbi:MAG: hypothetical protein RL701_6670 [Pseudomonadota bacterium]|jgi:uncharacterized Zn-binding protein involved in type VI secretion
MPITVNANGLSVVHRGSGAIATATMPDVCKTPGPSGAPTPVPYPNIAMSSDLVAGTTTVTVDGQMAAIQGSKFAKSTGDEAGSLGGVVSQVFIMEATFVSFSPTVMMDGKPVCRLTDKMLMNHGNTACLAGVVQAPVLQNTCPVPMPIDPEKPKFCVFEQLQVTCTHQKSRKFKLKASETPGGTLQVIAGKKPEKIQFAFEGSCGDTSASPGCAKVIVLDPEGKLVPVGADYTVELPLTRDFNRFGDDWLSFIRFLFTSEAIDHDTYTAYGITCDGTGEGEVPAGEYALIEVYPNASLEGELEFGFSFEKKDLGKDRQGNKKKSISQLDEQGKFEVKGTLTATLGRTTVPYSFGSEGEGSKAQSAPADATPRANLKPKDSPLLHHKPYISLQVEADRLPFQVYVNGAFVTTELTGTQVNETWPINQLMRSGTNKIALLIRPWSRAEGPAGFEANSRLTVKILVRESGQPDGPEHELLQLSFNGAGVKTPAMTEGSSPDGDLDSNKDFERVRHGDVTVGPVESKSIDAMGSWLLTRDLSLPLPFPEWEFLRAQRMKPAYELGNDAEALSLYERALSAYEGIWKALEAGKIDAILPLFEERSRETDLAMYQSVGTTAGKLKAAFEESLHDKGQHLAPLRPVQGFWTYDVGPGGSLVQLVRGPHGGAILRYSDHRDERYQTGFPIAFRLDGEQLIVAR